MGLGKIGDYKMEKKFDGAYFETEHRVIKYSDLLELYQQNPTAFKQIYNPHLKCPKCMVPRLNFINASTPHLKIWPRERHAESCSIKNPYMNSQALLKACKDEATRKSIKHSLEYLLRNSQRDMLSADEFDVITENQGSIPLNTMQKVIKQKRYHVPARKLTSRLTENDIGVIKRFYGTVKLRWAPQSFKWKAGRSLALYLPDENRAFCSVNMPLWMFEEISKQVVIAEIPKEYEVAFAGEFELKSGRYFDCQLQHSDLFQIRTP